MPAEPQEKSSRGPRLGIVTALAIFAGVVIVIIYGYLARPGWIGVSGKQFWDYLDLLIVPAALALGVYWLNRRQSERDQQAEDSQQERALAVESQRAQDEALQAYLDQMAQLLIEHPLRRARLRDNLSTVARARTLTVLPRLDWNRKGSVLQFLYESDLIERRHNIVSLQQADLSSADLIRANLREADLSGADLHNAYLREADLEGADLKGANLSGAYLHNAYLREADLEGADLGGADLSGAYLHNAYLREVKLNEANLSGLADMRSADLSGASLYRAYLSEVKLNEANLSEARLIRADLSRADMRSADLTEANLTEADLREASLNGANLIKADLSRANLSGAYGSPEAELRAARSLKGATMPDGQKYEDWRKDREGWRKWWRYE